MAEPIRRPRRVATLRLPPPYDVYTVRAWINLSPTVIEDLRSGDAARLGRVMAEMVVEHNLTDFDGNPLPPAGSPDLYAALDPDLFQALWMARNAEVGRLSPPSAGS